MMNECSFKGPNIIYFLQEKYFQIHVVLTSTWFFEPDCISIHRMFTVPCVLYIVCDSVDYLPLSACYFLSLLFSMGFNNNFSFDRLETITTFLVAKKKSQITLEQFWMATMSGTLFFCLSFFIFFFNCSSFYLVGELCNWIMKLSLCKRLPLSQKLIRF